MTPLTNDFAKIANLANIEIDPASATVLANDVANILHFMQQLGQIDTTQTLPLVHPLATEQRLRLDEVHEKNCVTALEKIAPLFQDDLYLVPKIIAREK